MPSTSEATIEVQHQSKCYQIYATPHDQLKQFILPWLVRMAPAHVDVKSQYA